MGKSRRWVGTKSEIKRKKSDWVGENRRLGGKCRENGLYKVGEEKSEKGKNKEGGKGQKGERKRGKSEVQNVQKNNLNLSIKTEYYTVAPAPAVTGTAFMPRFSLFLALVK